METTFYYKGGFVYDSIYITYVGVNDNIDFGIVGLYTGDWSLYSIVR